jgi:hypothetical protein
VCWAHRRADVDVCVETGVASGLFGKHSRGDAASFPLIVVGFVWLPGICGCAVGVPLARNPRGSAHVQQVVTHAMQILCLQCGVVD